MGGRTWESIGSTENQASGLTDLEAAALHPLDHSRHFCVGFLFFVLYPVRRPSAIRSSSFFPTHTHTTLTHTQHCHTHTQHCHTHTHNIVTHTDTHTQVFTHTQHCYTELFHTLAQNSFTYDSCTKSVLHHLLCLSGLSHPTSALVWHYWKKLTCGVIRSFKCLSFFMFFSLWCLKAREDCEGNGTSNWRDSAKNGGRWFLWHFRLWSNTKATPWSEEVSWLESFRRKLQQKFVGHLET